MKKTTILILFLNAMFAFGQQNAKNQIDAVLTQMLKEDGILLSDAERNCTSNCIWRKEKDKQAILDRDEKLKNKLLANFIVPSFCNDKMINKEYVFINKSICKLGSYIIRNGDFSVINSTPVPDLPVLLTGREVSIVDPKSDGSNYILNYTTESLFKGQSKTELKEEFLNYLNSKQDLSLNMDNSKRLTLTLGVGVFTNELAELFQRTTENKIKTKEFYALYDIWVKYSLNEIQSTDSVIKAFEGLCYYKGKGVETNSQIQFNAEFNGSYSQLPFLSINSSNKINWGQSTSLKVKAEIYDIFMFDKPQMASIPKPEIILTNWKRLSNIPDNVIQVSDNIPSKKPLEIQVKFGPIVHYDFINNIKLDEKYTLDKMPADKKFIEKIELINSDGAYIYDEKTNIVTFNIKIHRNEDFIKEYSSSAQLSTKLDIRLYYDQAVKINNTDKFLEIIYKGIPASAELKPILNVSNDIVNAEKNGNDYLFKYSGSFDLNTGQNIVQRPKVIDVLNIPAQTISSFKDRVKNTIFTLKANNEFDFTIKIPYDVKVFTTNQREMNIELLVEFLDSKNNTFRRKIPITLLANEEQIKTDTTSIVPIAFNSTESLIASLNDKTQLSDGTTVNDLKVKHTDGTTGQLNINNFLEELRSKSEMTISLDSKYLIKPMFIDNDKLKSYKLH
jgi:hypothetical protein